MSIISSPFEGVPEPLAAAMQSHGFEELTLVQQAVLASASAGRDLRISSQTGSGKTVALGLALAPHFLAEPSAAEGPTALVIVPTRELAAQVREELRWLYAGLRGCRIEVVTGGTPLGGERRQLARGPSLVVGTPGRLLDHIRSGALRCGSVAHVVLDEADRMLEMGFREELDAILAELPTERRSHLLSATFAPEVRGLADRFQRDPLHVQGTRPGEAHQDIEHVAHPTAPGEGYAALVNLLLLARGARCLVFVKRRADAADLAASLLADGFSVLPFSGELAQGERTRSLNAFRTGGVEILVSTDVAARGIDVPEIATVIHLEPPADAEAYVHRSGRTGRAGRKGRSILLVPSPQERRVRRLLAAANVEARWQALPTPEVVRESIHEQTRAALRERLDSAAPPGREPLARAEELLAGRDAATVVASLLELAAAKLPCEPMQVSALEPFSGRRPAQRPGSAVDRAGQSRKPAAAPRARSASQEFVRFDVNWGEEMGATHGRLLSHVCRRGGIQSHLVGAIEIDTRHAVIAVASEVADAFEARTRRPDERDPNVRIQRLRGAAARSGPPRPLPKARARVVEKERGRGFDKDRGRSFEKDRGKGPEKTRDRGLAPRKSAHKPGPRAGRPGRAGG